MSPNQHSTKHFHEHGHAISQRFEPAENWGWDYRSSEVLDPFPRGFGTGVRHIMEEDGYEHSTAAYAEDGKVVV